MGVPGTIRGGAARCLRVVTVARRPHRQTQPSIRPRELHGSPALRFGARRGGAVRAGAVLLRMQQTRASGRPLSAALDGGALAQRSRLQPGRTTSCDETLLVVVLEDIVQQHIRLFRIPAVLTVPCGDLDAGLVAHGRELDLENRVLVRRSVHYLR